MQKKNHADFINKGRVGQLGGSARGGAGQSRPLQDWRKVGWGGWVHCKFIPHENYGDWELWGKPALSMEKGSKNHKETQFVLWINPVIFPDCTETP